MVSSYCSHCQQQVLVKREDKDICLAIILAIFTAGIGLAIYLAIWYRKPINRCVHCNSITSPFVDTQIPNSGGHYPYQDDMIYEIKPFNNPFVEKSIEKDEKGKIKEERPQFCSLCGEKIELGLRFCPLCGNKI